MTRRDQLHRADDRRRARRAWNRLRTLGSDPRFVAEIDAMVAAIEAEDTKAAPGTQHP